MSRKNGTRSGCKDVFHAFLVKNATYDSPLEIPCLKTEMRKPNKLIAFSKAVHSTEYDAWVHFYEDDTAFERLWNRPNTYLPILKKFKGVISPDFSVYRDMPLVMQQWNTYRSRALAVWLQKNDVELIPNVRFNDERTYDFCFDGIEKYKTIAVGTHGCIKNKIDKDYFKKGLAELVKRLSPKTIIVYGATPDDIFKTYKDAGIEIISFESEFSKSRKQVTA